MILWHCGQIGALGFVTRFTKVAEVSLPVAPIVFSNGSLVNY